MHGNKFGNGRIFGNAKTVPKASFCSWGIDNNRMAAPGFYTKFSENSGGIEVCFDMVISESLKDHPPYSNCVNQMLIIC